MRQEGFTLAEMLIATAMMAIISLISLIMVTGVLAAHDDADRRVEAAFVLRTGIALIRADLAQIAPRRRPRDGNGVLLPGFVGGGRDGALPVMSLVRLGLGWPVPEGENLGTDLSYIEYVRRDGELIRRSREPVDAALGAEMTERVVFAGLSEFDVEYLGAGGWSDEWRQDTPPRAVALTLAVPDLGEVRGLFVVGAPSS